MSRRRPIKHKPGIVIPEIPIETMHTLDEPLQRTDAIIKQIEELLNDLKYLRLVISRRRDRDRLRLTQIQINKGIERGNR
jgi:hypothetical protein